MYGSIGEAGGGDAAVAGDDSERRRFSEEIHFDRRMTDETSTITHPLFYFASSEEGAIYNPTDHHLTPATLSPESSPQASVKELLVNEQETRRKISRIGVLLLVSLLPFGSHFSKNSFSSLQVFFLRDPTLNFTSTKYGALLSASILPNIFMPFIGGVLLDKKGSRKGLVLFLSTSLVGYGIFVCAIWLAWYPLAFLGQVISGFGTGTIIVAQRAVVAKIFHDRDLTFALGVTVAIASLSKMLAKATVAPVVVWFESLLAALAYIAFWLVVSLVAGIAYTRVASSVEGRIGEVQCAGHPIFKSDSLLLTLRRSTLAFWLVTILHTLFICLYHLFLNFSGHFLIETYDLSPVAAGLVSSIMPLTVVLVAPLAGLLLDRLGGQLWVLLAASAATLLAYVLLQLHYSAICCIVLLSVCESFVPMILLSITPLTVDSSVYGAAFGLSEACVFTIGTVLLPIVFSQTTMAVGLFVGNVFMGLERDESHSYASDINAVIVLAVVCIALTVVLIVDDFRRGGRLNCPRSVYGYKSVPA